jgi:uncharacterized tellurite resistance protein B-like protein
LIERIKQLFAAEISNPEGDLSHRQQLAAASLMVEVMVIDRHLEKEELAVIQRILRQKFQLDEAEIDNLITLAQQEVDESTSLYQFTRLVNDHFDQQSKNALIMNLWQVAFADDEIDKHEEAIIRRIAELIYVPHSDFIRAKHEARKRA